MPRRIVLVVGLAGPALAVVGGLLARWFPVAILPACPYLRLIQARCLADGYRRVHLPYLVARVKQ